MASVSFTARFFNLTLLIFIFMASKGFCFQFDVGGDKGWVTPSEDDKDIYNEWATDSRFNIGDTIYFKYQNDSVLEVNDADYKSCNPSNPLDRYEDGATVFQFDRSGPFYFISGEEEHCLSGQRLIIQVIHPTQDMISSGAVSPSSGTGQDPRDPAPSPLKHTHHSGGSSLNFNASSFFITTVGVMFAFLYRFA